MGLTVVMSEFGILNDGWEVSLRDRLDWCNENCSELVLHDALAKNIRWEFVSEEDAMAFKLRWS